MKALLFFAGILACSATAFALEDNWFENDQRAFTSYQQKESNDSNAAFTAERAGWNSLNGDRFEN